MLLAADLNDVSFPVPSRTFLVDLNGRCLSATFAEKAMPHILLVEDDTDTALAMQELLEALGHQVTRAENGKAAVRFVQNGLQPDLVLTDIIMPDMDGIETVQTFHTLLKATPIIAMSALSDA